MATANNTIKTRIQLKSDTEANWEKAKPKEGSQGFIPLKGELIIYAPDETHDYSRLKVGDGVTNVVYLPFVDAGTINGIIPSAEIIMINGTFPVVGDSTKLYVDTTTRAIYIYYNSSYSKVSNLTYTFNKSAASTISSWYSGRQPTMTVTGGRLSILSGATPELIYANSQFVQSATKEGDA